MNNVTMLSLIGVLGVVGCDSNTTTQLQVEESMRIAKNNASYNAGEYIRSNPRFSGDGWVYVARADSFQDLTCPQGDGWADVSFMRNTSTNSKDAERWPAVCSTRSQDLGCYLVKDLPTKPEITRQFNTCAKGYTIRPIAESK